MKLTRELRVGDKFRVITQKKIREKTGKPHDNLILYGDEVSFGFFLNGTMYEEFAGKLLTVRDINKQKNGKVLYLSEEGGWHWTDDMMTQVIYQSDVVKEKDVFETLSDATNAVEFNEELL